MGRITGRILKLLTAHALIPHDTNPSIKLAIKRVHIYDDFKRELRTTLNCLDSFSHHRGAGAHVIEGEQDTAYEPPAFGHCTSDEPEPAHLAIMAATLQKLGFDSDPAMAAAQVRRNNQKAQLRRTPTPPRGAKDAKCANCNQTGHTAQNCSKPKKAISDRLCHTCNKPGHVARRCLEKDKVKLAV